MDGTNVLKKTTRVTAPVASNTLGVNVFTGPGKGHGRRAAKAVRRAARL
jgi:hypothetical protein